LTKDNKMPRRGRIPAPVLFLAALVCCQTVSGSDLPTKEITSNNIYGLAGSGDTLWMVTDQGVNYTIATSDTLTWLGYKASFRIISFAFGAQNVIACLDTTAAYPSPNRLWYYSHPGLTFNDIALPFARASLSSAVRDSAMLSATSVAYGSGFFWLACGDGGLVRLDPQSKSMRAFFPGITRSFDPAALTLDSATFGITAVSDLVRKRIIGVSVQRISPDTTAIIALTRSTLYRFFPRDTSWDTLSSKLEGGKIIEGAKIIDRYNTVFASAHSPYIFADISANGQTASTLYRYDPADTAWKVFDTNFTDVTGLTFGPDSVTYLVIKNKSIEKYSGITHFSRSFYLVDKRITAVDPEFINDILYLPHTDTSGSFWIATSSTQSPAWNGLFFSRNEERDERDSIPFVYVRRDRKISSGLKETYAVPGILSSGFGVSNSTSQAVFAYSLSKASNVTISVYDWNMNLVKNVVVNQPRSAGKDDPLGNGRSTNRREDTWDGTNSAGKRVAVGVYYFKITAKSGERSFGKIIVAK
jgi:hypothetical protein